jgi:hypothetical protein
VHDVVEGCYHAFLEKPFDHDDLVETIRGLQTPVSPAG